MSNKRSVCPSFTHKTGSNKASLGFMLPFLESGFNFKSFLWSVSTLLSIFFARKKLWSGQNLVPRMRLSPVRRPWEHHSANMAECPSESTTCVHIRTSLGTHRYTTECTQQILNLKCPSESTTGLAVSDWYSLSLERTSKPWCSLSLFNAHLNLDTLTLSSTHQGSLNPKTNTLRLFHNNPKRYSITLPFPYFREVRDPNVLSMG